MPDKNNTNLAKTPLFMRLFANSRMVYIQYYRPRLCNKSSKISAFLLQASLTACSRTEINLNKPQSRCFRPFRQNLARRIDIRLRSPLLKIIKNGGFEVASEFNGKKTIKTRQSSEVVLECTTSENNTVFSGIFAVKSSSSLFPFG